MCNAALVFAHVSCVRFPTASDRSCCTCSLIFGTARPTDSMPLLCRHWPWFCSVAGVCLRLLSCRSVPDQTWWLRSSIIVFASSWHYLLLTLCHRVGQPICAADDGSWWLVWRLCGLALLVGFGVCLCFPYRKSNSTFSCLCKILIVAVPEYCRPYSGLSWNFGCRSGWNGYLHLQVNALVLNFPAHLTAGSASFVRCCGVEYYLRGGLTLLSRFSLSRSCFVP